MEKLQIKCIGCESNHLRPLEKNNFECLNCTLRFTSFDPMDYKESYSDDDSIYGENLKMLNTVQCPNKKIRLLPFEERIIETLSRQKIKSICDIGCGIGRFLKAIKSIHLKSLGFEVVPALVQKLKGYGYSVELGGIDEFLNQHQNYFEAISLLEVIEHLKNPKELLDRIIQTKNPKFLFIVVPDYKSRRLFDKSFLLHDVPPNHLSWWTKKALDKMLIYSGYDTNVSRIRETRRSIIFAFLRNRKLHYKTSFLKLILSLIFPPCFWFLATVQKINENGNYSEEGNKISC